VADPGYDLGVVVVVGVHFVNVGWGRRKIIESVDG